MITHFISDLHLDNQKPAITEILLRYLGDVADHADRLYLLGDIFEYWLGDDVSLGKYPAVCSALKAVSDSGVALYFMRGNRDFLVGEDFAAATGCQLLEDPQVIEIAGRNTLISHGDMLCTDDIEHQKFRELVCQPAVRARLLSLTGEQREQMAQQIRGMSKSGNAMKAKDIMDVSAPTVESVMREYGVDLLIHGHTHRCAIHRIEVDATPAERVVLSDWNENEGNVLVCDDNGFAFQSLS